jgi:cellulose synthase/poly-beta-1,6-N-acetylglucosamine synthase-like glycosyltransferase
MTVAIADVALIVAFLLSAAVVAVAYAAYPLWAVWRSRRAPSVAWATGPVAHPVSIIVTAFNEEQRIGSRLEELQQLADALSTPVELILVDDGSTDATAAVAARVASSSTKILTLPRNAGKAASINRAVEVAAGEILVLADVRQRWTAETLPRLLAPFVDPTVGAAAGALVLSAASGTNDGVGAYWRMESALRKAESATGSCVGVSGAICAVRKSLMVPLPEGLILDDVYWPMHVIRQGRRVVYVEQAVAFDALPAHASHEFNRKVRTLAGNYQLLHRAPWLLSPSENPAWSSFVAHKVLRLAAPWALLCAFVCTFLLRHYPLFGLLFGLQLLAYALAGFALVSALRRPRLLAAAAAFLLLNVASALALWKWLLGEEAQVWKKADYRRT